MGTTADLIADRHGQTYAAEAGIRLADKPSPLFQLLVLALLLSARISSDIAVAAARELNAAGYRTPRAMTEATWQDRVDALGRGHYRRYDERTSTMLADAADHLLDRWNGDLRRLHDEGGDDPGRLRQLLQEFKGIGPFGADIFLREVQPVWTGIAPYADRRVAQAARRFGLPKSALAGSPSRTASLAAALVRLSQDRKAADALERELAHR
ncbi:endonuclease [Kribbella karoonensis]|uniref:Endonuclease n=1 Tax=Kribbella karoonensis TaxID=324851 RepID=A0ABN2CY24_9ACTN|nr:endonuclease [Kribbella sp.]